MLGLQLAVCVGNLENAVTVVLNGAGFVDLDMAAVGGDNRFPGAQEGIQRYLIGLGAADQKMHIRLGASAEMADPISGPAAVVVHTIAYGQFQIGLAKGVQHPGVGAIAVVVSKMEHMCYLIEPMLLRTRARLRRASARRSSVSEACLLSKVCLARS